MCQVLIQANLMFAIRQLFRVEELTVWNSAQPGVYIHRKDEVLMIMISGLVKVYTIDDGDNYENGEDNII